MPAAIEARNNRDASMQFQARVSHRETAGRAKDDAGGLKSFEMTAGLSAAQFKVIDIPLVDSIV